MANAKPDIGLRRLDASLKQPMPHLARPMLATLADACFDKPGWIYEIKWDGYRAMAELRDGNVQLYSRNLQPFNASFPGIVRELEKISGNLILDGEIIAVDDTGKPSFQLIQDYKNQQDRLYYYVFDLLYLNGYDLRSLPLIERKTLLEQTLPELNRVRYSTHQFEHGCRLFELVAAEAMEGLIAKDASSPYLCGKRTGAWLKIKTRRHQEAIIVGFTEPRGSRPYLGSLILAARDGKELRYIGHTGTGFDTATLKRLREMLEPLETAASPFTKTPAAIKRREKVHWVKPRYVCETEFQEWTNDMHMRHPVFLGLRAKPPGQVYLDHAG